MRPLLFTLIACAASLASCASSNTKPSTTTASAPNEPARFVLRNDSRSTLTVQQFVGAPTDAMRQPFESPIIIAPGQTESRDIGAPGKVVSVTIKASGQDIKYQSGEWVLQPRAAGWRLYAFTDDSGTVRLNWNDRGGEVIQMQ